MVTFVLFLYCIFCRSGQERKAMSVFERNCFFRSADAKCRVRVLYYCIFNTFDSTFDMLINETR